jgi:CheY-like chemotaxis protein
MTDIVKPDISGLELLARLRNHPTLHDIPVVVFSACSGPDIVAQALELGASDYLIKPCGPDDLVSAVSSLVDGGRRWAAMQAGR